MNITRTLLATAVIGALAACGTPRTTIVQTSPPQVATVAAVAPPVAVVDVAPPAPYVEAIPPQPYAGAVWIPGYWGWSNGRHEWIAGHWDTSHPGYHWVPAHWEQVGGHWQLISGAWSP